MRSLIICLLFVAVSFADTPGDVNQSGETNIADVMCLVDYIFNGEPLPQTEWVEVDTTVSVVWILDEPFPVDRYPITVQKHYYVTSTMQLDTSAWSLGVLTTDGHWVSVYLIDTTIVTDTTWLREIVITDAEFWTGTPLIRTRTK